MLEFEDIEPKKKQKGEPAISDKDDQYLIGSNSLQVPSAPKPIKVEHTIYTGVLLFDTAYHKKGQTLQFIDAGDSVLMQDQLHVWSEEKAKYLICKSTIDKLTPIDKVERTKK